VVRRLFAHSKIRITAVTDRCVGFSVDLDLTFDAVGTENAAARFNV